MKKLSMALISILAAGIICSCGSIDIEKETKKGIRQYEADSLNFAIKILTNVINETDSCSECFQYRGFAYKDLKEYDKALIDFDSFVKLNSNKAYGYANRGSIHYINLDYEKALVDFKYALKLDSSFTAMYNTISHMLYATGRKDEACDYYQWAIAFEDTAFDHRIIEYCSKEQREALKQKNE
jgi:tetratricopeptide (TPR) repeat protein